MATKDDATLLAELTVVFPDNVTQLITEAILRGQQTDIINSKINVDQIGASSGVAPLDVAMKVPLANLPDGVISGDFMGNWNANTNTPALADGVGNNGDFYYVDVGGTQDLGSGPITFNVGDAVKYSASNVWVKIPGYGAIWGVDIVNQPALIDQATAEAGADTSEKIWSALRVYQAIVANAKDGVVDVTASNPPNQSLAFANEVEVALVDLYNNTANIKFINLTVDADYVLSNEEARCSRLVFTDSGGVLTQPRKILWPDNIPVSKQTVFHIVSAGLSGKTASGTVETTFAYGDLFFVDTAESLSNPGTNELASLRAEYPQAYRESVINVTVDADFQIGSPDAYSQRITITDTGTVLTGPVTIDLFPDINGDDYGFILFTNNTAQALSFRVFPPVLVTVPPGERRLAFYDKVTSQLKLMPIYTDQIPDLVSVLAGYEPAFAKNTAFNKNFGTTAGTVAEGNHTHPVQAEIYSAKNNAAQTINGGTVVAFQVETVTDTSIVTKSGNEFTLQKSGKYRIEAKVAGRGNSVLFATERSAEVWLERADGGAFSIQTDSYAQQNWNPGSGGTTGNMMTMNAIQVIDDAAAGTTKYRVVGFDPSGTDWSVDNGRSTINIEYLGA